MHCKMINSSIDKNGHMGKLKIKIKNYQTLNSEKIKIKKKNGVNSQGFLKADAAPITTADDFTIRKVQFLQVWGA